MSLNWGVQVARLTLFLSEPHSISDKDWSIITGQEEAETRQVVPGGKRLSGAVPNGTLHMIAAGPRVDVILSAAELEEDGEVKFPSVGSYEETFQSFFDSTAAWIKEILPPTHRIAFGSVLTYPTEGREQAYEHLNDLLTSVEVVPANMRDLQYRVNWPQVSGVEQGLVINRLTTWSSLRIIRKLFQIDLQKGVSTDKGTEAHAVRLEMDHNTDDTRNTPFDPVNVIPIYSELVGLARVNAAEGEVK